jgi:hypothetical protein
MKKSLDKKLKTRYWCIVNALKKKHYDWNQKQIYTVARKILID